MNAVIVNRKENYEKKKTSIQNLVLGQKGSLHVLDP
jgi:hypothetical protein